MGAGDSRERAAGPDTRPPDAPYLKDLAQAAKSLIGHAVDETALVRRSGPGARPPAASAAEVRHQRTPSSPLRSRVADENAASIYASTSVIPSAPVTSSSFVELRRFGLTKVPKNVGKLTLLFEIDLSFNRLDEFPKALASLPALERCRLAGNHISSTPGGMQALTQMPSLRLLDLSRNRINLLPQGLPVTLEHLNLECNQLGSLPLDFAQRLTRLRYLNLAENLLRELPHDLGALDGLSVLLLAHNQLTIWPSIEAMDLSRLSLHSQHNAGVVRPPLPPLPPTLTELDVRALDLTALPDGELPRLLTAELSRNAFEQLPDVIFSWTGLQELQLNGTPVRQLPARLVDMTSLRVLSLRYTQLGSSVPDVVFDLVNLRELDLSGNVFEELPKRIAALDQLELLGLAFNSFASLPLHDLANMARLRVVSVTNTPFFDQLSSEHQAIHLRTGHVAELLPEHHRRVSPPVHVDVEPIAQAELSERQTSDPNRLRGTTLSRSAVRDKMLGIIFGQAIGDAVGLATEFLDSRKACLAYSGLHDVHFTDILRDRHRSHWLAGDWTDDTDQCILVLDMLIKSDLKVNPVAFAQSLVTWAHVGFPELGDVSGNGIGRTVYQVLTHPDVQTDPHSAAADVNDRSQGRAAANGAVMRTSVLSLHSFDDLDHVVDASVNVCRTTHADPRCLASCVAINVALAMILRGQDVSSPEGIAQLKAECLPRAMKQLGAQMGQYGGQLEAFMNSHLFELQLDEPSSIGYTFKAMGAGFAVLDFDTFSRAINMVTMAAGDADTNGAVAGAVMGAKVGFSGLPAYWVETLPHKDWLLNKAERLVDLILARMDEEWMTVAAPMGARAST